MDIFKSSADKKSGPRKRLSKKSNPRGAVIKQQEKSQEELSLGFKKKIYDQVVTVERKFSLNKRIYLLFILLLMMLVLATWSLENIKTEMPIDSVVVKGDFLQINKSDLEKILSPLVGSNYFDTNIANIKNSLMGFSWIQSVQVRKIWPAKLEVMIVENKAIAIWGEDGFVNEFGKVFKPKQVDRHYLQGLPDLNGLDKESDLVLNTYVNLSNISRHYGLTIKKFSLVANSYWKVQFSNNVELMLAKGGEEGSIETFLQAYEQDLKHSNRSLVLVDMRYNNGFSVLFDENEKTTEEIVEIESEKELKKMNMSSRIHSKDIAQQEYISKQLDENFLIKIKKRFLTSIEKAGMHHG